MIVVLSDFLKEGQIDNSIVIYYCIFIVKGTTSP